MKQNDEIAEQRRDIIAKLTQARMEKGVSQAELAGMVGTQRSNICRLESGAQNPGIDTLLKISAALGKKINFELSDREEADMQTYILKLYDREKYWIKYPCRTA